MAQSRLEEIFENPGTGKDLTQFLMVEKGVSEAAPFSWLIREHERGYFAIDFLRYDKDSYTTQKGTLLLGYWESQKSAEEVIPKNLSKLMDAEDRRRLISHTEWRLEPLKVLENRKPVVAKAIEKKAAPASNLAENKNDSASEILVAKPITSHIHFDALTIKRDWVASSSLSDFLKKHGFEKETQLKPNSTVNRNLMNFNLFQAKQGKVGNQVATKKHRGPGKM